ncbi:MAG: hypothetical protein M1824_006365 [Vezdaea acicularis]|nr:MAG: hypothetical protein M1824_006365 [Vezdaea acicularis]
MPPPRLSILTHLRPNFITFHRSAPNGSTPIRPSLLRYSRLFSHTPANAAVTRKYRDPYSLAQARQRKAANIARQAVLKKEREAVLGDPVRGITTPWIESLNRPIPPPVPQPPPKSNAEASNSPTPTPSQAEGYLTDGIRPSEFAAALQYSFDLTKPLEPTASDLTLSDPAIAERATREHAARHASAVTSMARILTLENANTHARRRANIQRCIETFGRHHTDHYLTPRAPSNVQHNPEKPAPPEKTPRAGPDVGSSEVQIAVLTTKIQGLVSYFSQGNRKDQAKKRRLRLLVHKRQKLLKYLQRKERGSARWENVVKTLGLTEGTWRGEITL